jgi:hypothetical protein
MSLRAELNDEMKAKIAAIKAGKIPEPTRQPVDTFTDAPKGKGK